MLKSEKIHFPPIHSVTSYRSWHFSASFFRPQTELRSFYSPWLMYLCELYQSLESSCLLTPMVVSCWFCFLNLPQSHPFILSSQLLLLWSRPSSFLLWIIVIVYLSETLPLTLLPPFSLCAICCQIHLKQKNRSYNGPTVFRIDFNFLVRHKWTVMILFLPIPASPQVLFFVYIVSYSCTKLLVVLGGSSVSLLIGSSVGPSKCISDISLWHLPFPTSSVFPWCTGPYLC